ncbi:MAG: efflux RND transporter permease subunit [Gracilibacteraceae bacterium]|jgi:multidrug efflux pump subunit AcrB|nr:efflux RND transporter permease subunit [Gracilibacteraceae bacterium]
MAEKKSFLSGVIEKRNLVLLIVAIILLAGVFSYNSLPRQEYPIITMPMAVVTAIYPGASAQDIEELVTKKVEDLAMSAKYFDKVMSQSYNGAGVVMVYFDMTADPALLDDSKADLRYSLEALQSTEFPAGVTVQYSTDTGDTAGLLLAVTGEGRSRAELAERAETLKSGLRGLAGVKSIEISGERQEQIKVSVDIGKLNKTAVSLSDIAALIQYQNSLIPAGNIEFADDVLTVQTSGIFTDLKDIEELVVGISGETGATTRLRDIALIEKTADGDAKRYQYNGDEAILLSLHYQDKINIVSAGKKVMKAVEAYKAGLPDDIRVETVVDLGADVNASVTNFLVCFLDALVIVIAVIMLGMNLRNGGIIAFALPVTVMISFLVMKLLGIDLQFISLAALIMVLGMLVDNAVVVSDQIQVRLDKGDERQEACVNGVKDVAFPVLASTLTIVSIFTMFYSLPGSMSKFINSLPTVVITAILASYAVSIFVTPIMCYLFMKPSKTLAEGKLTLLGRLGNAMDKLLQLAFAHKRAAIVVALLFLLGAVGLLSMRSLTFLPTSNKAILDIKITAPGITDIRKADEAVQLAADIVRIQPETAYYATAVGGNLPRYDFCALPTGDGVNKGNVVVGVDLAAGGRFESNAEFLQYLQAEMNSRIPSCAIEVNQLDVVPSLSKPIQVRVMGDDSDALNAAASVIEAELYRMGGTLKIQSERQLKTEQYYVDIDDAQLNAVGLTKAELQGELNAALMGRQVSVFRQDAREYPIIVAGTIHSSAELLNFGIKTGASGIKYQLKQLAALGLKDEYESIARYNGKRMVLVSAFAQKDYSALELQSRLEKEIAKRDMGDVELLYEGDSFAMGLAIDNLITGAVIGVLGIMLVLFLLFNSFRQMLYALTAMPFVVVGSSLAILLTGLPLSFFAILGILSLLGVVVNNAILLVDFINRERARGGAIDAACREAVRQRFRPVFLSTMTAVLGMLPLALRGNALFTGMVTCFMFGDTMCMFFTLIIVPVVYGICENRKNLKARR